MSKRGKELLASPIRFLDQSDRCLFTLETAAELVTQKGNQLETEHLFHQSAGNKHRRLFRNILTDRTGREIGDLIDMHENQVRLCTKCHDKVDDGDTGKPQMYRKFKIFGLVREIGNYRRSPDPDLYNMQYMQWRLLFGTLAERFDLLRSLERVPSPYLEDYKNAENLVHVYLYEWEQGKFEVHPVGNGSSRSYSYSVDRNPIPFRDAS